MRYKPDYIQEEQSNIIVRIVRNKLGQSRGFAYVDFVNEQFLHACLELDGTEIGDSRLSVKISKPPSKGENDQNTLFVNNLSFKTSQQELYTLFQVYGELSDVRLIYDDFNNPKGYGYIEFVCREDAEKAARQVNQSRIKGRVLNVMMANSVKVNKNQSNFTIHVGNVPFSATQADMQEIFGKIGAITKMVLPRGENGMIKGFAFIEYDNEQSVREAIKIKSVMLKDRVMTIKQSTRKITISENQTAKVNSKQQQEVKKKQIIKKKAEDDDLFKAPLPKKKARIAINESGPLNKKDLEKKQRRSNQQFAASLFG